MNEMQIVSVNDATNDTEMLKAMTTSMKEFVATRNAKVLSQMCEKLDKNPSLLEKIFPGPLKKEFERLRKEELKDVHNAQKLIMGAYTQSVIKIAEQEGNAIIEAQAELYDRKLKSIKMANHKELAALAQQCVNEMTETFKKSTTEFLERRDGLIKELEKYKNDTFIHDRVTKNLDSQATMFLDTIDDLLLGFRNTLKEKFGVVPK